MAKQSLSAAQDNNGFLTCPKCGAQMVPMKNGKGWRCGVPGNFWNGKGWSKCDGIRWDNTPAFTRQKVERPLDFPTIKTPTTEQVALYDYFSKSVKARGGFRCLIVDAGPGTAKTTSNCWAMRGVAQRIDSFTNWWQVAFNRNARATLEAKLPTEVVNIGTINSFGARVQGYNASSFKSNKLYEIFKGSISHIEYEKRPKWGGFKNFIDRTRDMLLYCNDPGDKGFWQSAVAMVAARFPAEGKKLTNPAFADVLQEYLPELMIRAHTQKQTIDITEQVTRPVTEAIYRSGWLMLPQMADKNFKWGDEEIRHLCRLIKVCSELVPQQEGIVVDEAQDLSLSQIVLFLASTWRKGEIAFIGDDRAETEDGELIKAGQGIFGWRGAFPGSLTLIRRLWEELTGTGVKTLSLSVTHRCPPEVVDAVKPLNSVLKSSKPVGSGEAWKVTSQQAWSRWLNLPEGKTALWITRTNLPLASLFLQTLKARKQVSLRSSEDMGNQIDGVLYSCAGFCDPKTGEFKQSLRSAINNLQKVMADKTDENSAEERDDLASFILEIMEEVNSDPSILTEANLPSVPTVGNVKRFLLHFASKDAPRTLTTVYRSKGDEADLVIVDDADKFNQAWNNDEAESAACRHVACTRSIRSLLVIGGLAGVNVSPPPDDGTSDSVTIERVSAVPAPVAPASPPVVKGIRKRK